MAWNPRRLDSWARQETFLHRLDPRGKILCLLLAVLVVVTLPRASWLTLFTVAGMVVLLAWAAQLPWTALFWRALIVLPFLLAVALFVPFTQAGEPLWQGTVAGFSLQISRQGVETALSLLAQGVLSALLVLLLVATTPLEGILQGLDGLGMPRAMTMIVGLTYRHLSLTVETARQLLRARQARCGDRSPRRLGLRAAAGLLGSLFVRSLDRAWRTHLAMRARGFTGIPPVLFPLRWRLQDSAALLVWLAVLLLLRFWVNRGSL
jgi:cobalt/nickel transport system permease protein